ncbi:MAG: MBL fold metallo-hydrolase [Candidatus Korarchaeota archaeon]
MVEIEWFGHACFAVKMAGKTIVIDPHDGTSLGLPEPNVKADIVLITHHHFDHENGLRLVKKSGAVVIDSTGKREINGIKIEGVETYHDEMKGKERGKVNAFVIEGEGIKIAHLGDIGVVDVNLPAVDVLMVPVGGKYTIDAKQAKTLVERVNPRVIIPMHFKIKGLNLPIAGPDEFVSKFANVKSVGKKVEFSSLPKTQEVWLFSL